MADILKVAEQLNSEVTRLNNERSKMEGMLESARTNYERAVKAYEVKYGVKLTEETLQKEYNEVFAKTKGAMLDLQEKIESIKRGDYKQDVESVEYDLEPDVEPIRAEKPAKKTRKSKTKVEIPTSIENAEEIKPVEQVEEKVDSAKIADLEPDTSFDLGFAGFGDTTVVGSPEVKEEEKKPVETDVKPKGKTGRKPLSGADLSAAVKASENIVQTPVTIPELNTEDSDEVDLGSLGITNGKPFGEKPDNASAEVESEGFSGFGDFGGFGNITDTEPKKESVEDKKEESTGFGGFGDFSGFGGFGDIGTTPDKEEEKKVEPVSDLPVDFSFGGLGDIGKESKSEEKVAPVTPEGWGSDFKLDSSSFDALLNASDVKFGE